MLQKGIIDLQLYYSDSVSGDVSVDAMRWVSDTLKHQRWSSGFFHEGHE